MKTLMFTAVSVQLSSTENKRQNLKTSNILLERNIVDIVVLVAPVCSTFSFTLQSAVWWCHVQTHHRFLFISNDTIDLIRTSQNTRSISTGRVENQNSQDGRKSCYWAQTTTTTWRPWFSRLLSCWRFPSIRWVCIFTFFTTDRIQETVTWCRSVSGEHSLLIH